jgi:hypothetical protein
MELKRYLRVVASTGDDDDDYSMVEISNRRAREAADRIEKLEAALASVLRFDLTDETWVKLGFDPLFIRDAFDAARKALEGKDDAD